MQREHQTSAKLFRSGVCALLEKGNAQENVEAFSASERKVIDVLNQYLAYKTEEPIVLDDYKGMPEAFGHHLYEIFNIPNLTQKRGVFNDSDDALERVKGREENKMLSNVMMAIGEYLVNKGEPMIYRGSDGVEKRYHKRDYSEQALDWKLWQQNVTQAGQGEQQSEERCFKQVESYEPFGKKLIVIGGAYSTTLNETEVDRLSRQAERLLGGSEVYQQFMNQKDAQLLAISHPALHRPFSQAHVYAYNADPEHYMLPHTQAMFDTIFKPLIDDALDGPRNQRAMKLRSNLSQLNFMCWSTGGVVIKTLSTCMTNYLRDQGVSKEIIKEALSSVFVLDMASVARLDDRREHGHFSSVYVISPDDLCVRGRSGNHRFLQANQKITPFSDNELILQVDLPDDGFVLEADKKDKPHGISVRNYPDKKIAGKPNPSGHHVKMNVNHVYSSSKQGAAYHSPEPLENALRHAVTRDDAALDGSRLKRFVKEKLQLFKPAHPYWVKNIFSARRSEIEEHQSSKANDR